MARPSKPLIGIDPEISMEEALKYTSGNQKELAQALGTTQASVGVWKKGNGKLPPLFAYRFVSVFKNRCQEQLKMINEKSGKIL